MEPIDFELDKILDKHKISVYLLAKESQVPYGTIWRLVHNKTPAITLPYLKAILDTLCILTGECYTPNDIIGYQHDHGASENASND